MNRINTENYYKLIKTVAYRSKVTQKDARLVVDILLDTIKMELYDNKGVTLLRFGNFHLTKTRKIKFVATAKFRKMIKNVRLN